MKEERKKERMKERKKERKKEKKREVCDVKDNFDILEVCFTSQPYSYFRL